MHCLLNDLIIIQRKKNLITHKPRKNFKLSDPQLRDSVRLYYK